MATIVLQAAGAFLGGLFGSVGAAVGTAAGALAGHYIDSRIIASTQHFHGPRMDGMQPFSAEEGRVIPRVYGTYRVGGTLIWATRFEETAHTQRTGGKGGPKVTNYSYFANAAFAVCEGRIAGIRRIWADGKEIDQTLYSIRIHDGSDDQQPDPLIEARQGSGNAPAYRGTAYVVFERFPLEDFGNRLPQFQFEVIRPVGETEEKIEAVCLIPGATEFGLSPTKIRSFGLFGQSTPANRNVSFARSDWEASLDELQSLCPNLKNVALVVAWFGDNLDIGQCRVVPKLPAGAASIGPSWSVCGIGRGSAERTSSVDGKAAYGGTPADATVIAAIRDLKDRGLNVTLYPFILMDIPQGNGLADPYGAAEQATYPWRGRITCNPAPGLAGSPDRSAGMQAIVASFAGMADTADYSSTSGNVAYSGPASDFGYRRFILHCANLCRAAGGVDAFLIGSEMRGATTLRDDADGFPFVNALTGLAADVSAMLGASTTVTYAADWTEYSGYKPADGSGDYFFHLDTLWAHPAIGAVGIDHYAPLADWRDSDWAGGNPDGATSPMDVDALSAAILGGEGHDWYYETEAARIARDRTPITDGAYGKPWMFRSKDVASWWANAHHDRRGGIELAQPTAWQPGSKPVWLTETGAPAVQYAANQPNVFPDTKSSEAAIPHFSPGGREDLAPLRHFNAHHDFWSTHRAVQPQSGELSAVVDPSRIYAWSWDARPFPAFPAATETWGDGENWRTGHWLNGRLGCAPLGDLVRAILRDHGIEGIDTSKVDGFLSGYVIDTITDARQALEPLLSAFAITAAERPDFIAFSNTADFQLSGFGSDRLASGPVMKSEAKTGTAEAVTVMVRDPVADYEAVTYETDSGSAKDARREMLSLPAAADRGTAALVADTALTRMAAGRHSVSFTLAPGDIRLETGDVVTFAGDARHFRVTSIADGDVRTVEARGVELAPPPANRHGLALLTRPVLGPDGPPLFHAMDLPLLDPAWAPHEALRVAAWHQSRRAVSISVSADGTGYDDRRAVPSIASVGVVETTMVGPVRAGRIDHGSRLTVRMAGSGLESVTMTRLANGANACAVRSSSGEWEVLQFLSADEVGPDLWRLSGFLRGQGGTEDIARSGIVPGSPFVLLDASVAPSGIGASERGLALRLRATLAGLSVSPDTSVETVVRGGMRATLPLAPVHLRARRDVEESIELTWFRRDRRGRDDWDVADIPLTETTEQYQAEIIGPSGETVRTTETTEPRFAYPAVDRIADLGDLTTDFSVRVVQLGDYGPGVPTNLSISPATL